MDSVLFSFIHSAAKNADCIANLTMRRSLYRAASILGDINAVARGTIILRVIRKICWPLFSAIMGKFIK